MKVFSNLYYGNKEFVFVLDAIIALAIFIIFLIAINQYTTKPYEDTLSKLQISRTGSDIITVLDNQKMLRDYTYEEEVQQMMDDLLSLSYDMTIEIDHRCECSEDTNPSLCFTLKSSLICENTFVVGDTVPENKEIFTGERFFTRITTLEYWGNVYFDTFYYGKVKYWIWLKD